MGAMHDLIVPGSGTVAEVLSTIQQLCGEMKECQAPCTRLHQRLKSVLDSLVSLEKKNKKRPPPPEALGKYVAVISTTLSYLEHYRGKKLVFRLMKRQAMMDELRMIHEETDNIVIALGLTTTDKWKHQFEADQRTHRERLAASVDNAQEVLAELQDARSQQETMLTLKYEVELRPEQHDEATAKLLRTMMATVIRTSTTSVPKLPPWFLPPYEVRFKPKPFARGSFATVHRGVRGPNANVVVKCFLVDGGDVDERTRQNIEMEMNLWHQFEHPNVIKLLGASHISTPPFIVCEDATNGDLRSFLARSDANKQQLWRLLYQAALGLEYIHKKSVVHGDLKLNNVLVGADGQAKLSDFGLSAVRTSAILSETTGETPYTAGALRWRAPECLKKAPTFASDVYSFAMCIIEAVIGEPPFALLDDDSVHEKLRKGEIPDKPEKMSADVWELVVAMTNVDPAKRASLSQVLKTLKELADGIPTPSPQLIATVDVNTPIPAENTIATLENHEPLLDADIIVDILDNVAGMDDEGKEQSLLHLVRMCVKDEERPVMYEANAIQVLTNLVKSGRTYYTKLYALQCLKWAVVVDGKLPQSEFNSLRDSVSDVQAKELASVVSALTNGTGQEKEEAAVRCACIAARGNGGLWQGVTWLQPLVTFWQSLSEAQKLWVGMVQPLVSLLRSGNDTHKLWAAEAIGSLATENEAIRAEVVRADAITPLVELLSAGTDGQRHRSSFALKNLALQAGVCQSIAQKGAIAPLLRLARLGTAQQKQTTSALLGTLLLPSYPNIADVELERSITLLVALILIGSDEQKETAVAVLSDLAKDDATRSEISRTGGVAPLIGLLRTGTNAQKAHAASVVMNLACNDAISAEICREGGVAPLIELAWKGNQQQKTSAAGALLKLSFDVEVGAEVVRCKGISPLVELARTGSDQQKVYAAGALRNLAISNEVCAEISREGGVEALIRLLKSGTDRQKVGAIGALLNLYSSAAARSEIATMGGVNALLELLRTGTDEQQRVIACGLSHLAKYDEGRAEIAREGGIAQLVELLRAGSDQQKGYAADTIGDLAMSNDKIRAELKRGGSVPLLKKMSRSGSEELKESAARALQQLNGGCCIIM